MRPVRVLLVLLALGVACATGSLGFDAWRRVQDESIQLTADPSRLYSAPPQLVVGTPLDRDELVALFTALDAHPTTGDSRVVGVFDGHEMAVDLKAGAVRSLTVDGAARDSIELPPVPLTTWLGPS